MNEEEVKQELIQSYQNIAKVLDWLHKNLDNENPALGAFIKMKKTEADDTVDKLIKSDYSLRNINQTVNHYFKQPFEIAVDGLHYSVNLVNPGPNKLMVVKTIKEFTGLGLREAKDLADQYPSILMENVSYETATKFVFTLEDAGATVEKTFNAQ